MLQISGVFSKEVTDSSLEKVNDVKLEHGQAGLGHRSEVDIAGSIEQLDNLRGQGLLTEEEFQQQKAQVLAKLYIVNQSRDSGHE